MISVNQIPVLLLTGYLGSGKTTLLNRILSNEKGIRFAVIVNDIGEVNIDAELIQKGGVVSQQDESLIALQNGCICCTLKMDLIQQLHDLISQRQGQSQQPAFDYIVIEASGICEPAPIAQTILSYPQMVPQFAKDGIPALDCICSVVDAMRVRDEFMDMLTPSPMPTPSPTPSDDLASLVTEQIEFCNVILLNKVDEVNAEDLEHIRAIIRAIQPKAEIIECNYCDVPLERLLNTKSFNFEAVATSATWIHEVESPHHDHDDDDDDDEEHEHHHHEHENHEDHSHCDHEHGHCVHEHHHHDHEHGHSHMEEFGISTFVYYARRPFDLGLFDEFVAAHWPKSVIRCKGMCYFEEEYDMCYLFEQSGRQFNLRQAGQWYATMPEDELEAMKQSDATLRADWDPQYGDRMQKLVFIGQNMDRKAITDALDYCLV